MKKMPKSQLRQNGMMLYSLPQRPDGLPVFISPINLIKAETDQRGEKQASKGN